MNTGEHDNQRRGVDPRRDIPETDCAGADFPAGVLNALETAFLWLCTRPHPVTVDGRAVAGLPAARVPLDELRVRLLDPITPDAVRDRVWAHLIRQARTAGPSWTVACAGMARPLLTGLGAELTRRFAGDPADIHAELVAGFLAGLTVVDPDRAPLVSLRWAAYRAGHAALTAAMDAPRPVPPHTLSDPGEPSGDPFGDTGTGLGDGSGVARRGDAGDPGDGSAARSGPCESCPPPPPPGHPDLVLARAVAAGAVTLDEAALIGSTRLEPVTLVQAADALGLPVGTVASTRYRAEGRLLAHLAHPDPTDRTHRDHSDDRGDGRGDRATTAGRPVRRGGRVSARAAVATRATAARATRTTTGPATGTTTAVPAPGSGTPVRGQRTRRRRRPARRDQHPISTAHRSQTGPATGPRRTGAATAATVEVSR